MTRSHPGARAGALLAAFALATFVPLARAAAPTDGELGRLGETLRQAKLVRVQASGSYFVERRVGLLAEGVRLAGDPQYGATDISPRQPALVPWAGLTAIEIRRGHADRGLLLGALAGFLIGATWANRPHDEQALGGASGELLFPFVGAACGAGVGAAIGAGYDPWTRVWPEPR